jgi:Na+-transporting NADH:ubiquinone oxidoreductase subunit F
MIVVWTLIFSNAFALTIAALIIFVDRVINRYGPCKIVINGDKEFTGEGGKTLLRMLFENKYFIPSACGGKGTCGYCKLKVVEGGGGILPTESLILTEREQMENYRLACQLKVKEDLRIEIPPEYLEIQEYVGKVENNELVTSDITRMNIRLVDPTTMDYKPGQYIQIKIPADGATEFRAYSMASNPDEKGRVEINVKQIPEGLGSTYIHDLEAGEQIDFSGPYGDFYLHTDSGREIVCVAGGVGLAPIKSIVMYWEAHGLKRTLWLFYGARTIDDLYDHEYFRDLDERFDRFIYRPALSEPGEEWTGETGFIHTVIEKELPPEPSKEAYLCGPPIMIDAVTEVLVAKKIPEERIWYDKF